nr:hypothetical protein [Tanacetum cinerariifolium]
MLCEWRVRKKGQEANPYEDYRDFPSVFCLKINHGGTFTTPHMIRYKGGYENPCMAYYYKKPNTELDNGLIELAVDKDVCEMLIEAEVDVSEDEWLKEALKKLPIKSKKGQQPIRKEVGQSSRNDSGSGNGSVSDSGSGSDSEDSDYFVDEENLIDDVDVDMVEFKSHTDPDVEWVECKETVVEENKVFELEEVDHEDFNSGSESDEDLEGYTRDLYSIWEETRQYYNFTRSGFKDARTVPGDGVAIPSDAVIIYK